MIKMKRKEFHEPNRVGEVGLTRGAFSGVSEKCGDGQRPLSVKTTSRNYPTLPEQQNNRGLQQR